ncbi:MAG TPA: hypothetical protein DD727_03135 [Clostridiales bacterium]|nr:hypothetical protein [Clostridiales bacterium]
MIVAHWNFTPQHYTSLPVRSKAAAEICGNLRKSAEIVNSGNGGNSGNGSRDLRPGPGSKKY